MTDPLLDHASQVMDSASTSMGQATRALHAHRQLLDVVKNVATELAEEGHPAGRVLFDALLDTAAQFGEHLS